MTLSSDQIIASMSKQTKISSLFTKVDLLKQEIYSSQLSLLQVQEQENPKPKDIHHYQDIIDLKQEELESVKSAIEALKNN